MNILKGNYQKGRRGFPLRNHNQDQMEHIKKLNDDEKLQEEKFKKLKNDKIYWKTSQSKSRRHENPQEIKSKLWKKK